jgi:23S rRNA (cytosine1962-C5)-methyltransferase
MKTLELLPKKELRIIKGDPWAWKADIKTPLQNFEPGEIVRVIDSKGRFVGVGYINPESLITVRLLTYEDREINYQFFEEKIREALKLRKELYPEEETFRLVFSEGDFLPGLVVDKFENLVVFQITTLGMEIRKDWIVKALDNILNPEIIVERSDSPVRKKEGLEPVKGIVKGKIEKDIVIRINGLNFAINPLEGQKTGFFLDQRENYLLLKNISKGRRVLDAFCNNGAFGIHAFKFGAREVVFLDASERALELVRKNLVINDIKDSYSFIKGDALKLLKEIERKGEKFDMIILDPPAFIKDRSKLKEGMRGYKEINLRAMKMLRDGGFLLTCSCSHFLSKENFLKVLEESAFDSGKIIKILDFRSQPKDHPYLICLPESNYLKCALLQVMGR